MGIIETVGRNAAAEGLSAPATSCRFCDIAAGRSSQWPDRVLFETQSYVVIASIGALVPGWTMVVPLRHTLNLADVFGESEFSALRRRVSATLNDSFPRATVRLFEHGSQGEGSIIGCGVDHAHVHLVPLPRTLEPWLRRQASGWHQLPLQNVATQLGGGQEYLLYSDDAESVNPECLLSLPATPVSQFFRRVVAAAQKRPDHFDYRTHPFFENVAATQAILEKSSLRIAGASNECADIRFFSAVQN